MEMQMAKRVGYYLRFMGWVFLLVAASAATSQADVNWNNNNGGDWSAVSRWDGHSPRTLPQPSDVVTIDRSANTIVTHGVRNPDGSITGGGSDTIQQLIAYNEIDMNVGHIHVTNDAAHPSVVRGLFNMNGGELDVDGAGNFRIENTFNFNQGRLAGAGAGEFSITSEAVPAKNTTYVGVMYVDGTNQHEKYIDHDLIVRTTLNLTTAPGATSSPTAAGVLTLESGMHLDNFGTFNVYSNTGADHFALSGANGGGNFTNQAGAVFNANVNGGDGFHAANIFYGILATNAGTFNVNGSGYTRLYGTYNQSGATFINGGSLDLSAGGSSTGAFVLAANTNLLINSPGYNFSSAGGSSVSAAAGATVSFNSGTSNVNIPWSIAGSTVMQGGAGINFNAGFNSRIDLITGTANFNAGSTLADGSTLQIATLAGNGNVSLGNMLWSGGAISGSGARNLLAGKTLTIDGNSVLTKTLAQHLTINPGATVNMYSGNAGAAGLQFFSGIVLTNNGTFNLNATYAVDQLPFYASAPTAYFNNNGVFNANVSGGSAGGATDLAYNMTFTNSGTFNNNGNGYTRFYGAYMNPGVTNINAGTMGLAGGGGSTGQMIFEPNTNLIVDYPGYTFSAGSSMTVPASSSVTFNSDNSAGAHSGIYIPWVLAGNTTVKGYNVVDFNSSFSSHIDMITGTTNFNGPAILSDGSSLQIATLGGTGDVAFGNFTWSGGAIAGSGARNLLAGKTLTIDGNSVINKTLARNLSINSGATVNMSSGVAGAAGLEFLSGIALTNNGTFNLNATYAVDQLPFYASKVPAAFFSNNGIFNANVTGGSSAGATDLAYNMVFTNAGTFNQNGTGFTRFYGMYNNSGATNVNDGTLDLAGGGASTGTFTLGQNGHLVIDSPGYDFDGGTVLAPSGGTVVFNGGFSNVLIPWSLGLTTVQNNASVTFLGPFNSQVNSLAGDIHFNHDATLRDGSVNNGNTFIGAGVALTLEGTLLLGKDLQLGNGATVVGGLLILGPGNHIFDYLGSANAPGYGLPPGTAADLSITGDTAHFTSSNSVPLPYSFRNTLSSFDPGVVMKLSLLNVSGSKRPALVLSGGSIPAGFQITGDLSDAAEDVSTISSTPGAQSGYLDLQAVHRTISVGIKDATWDISARIVATGGITKSGVGLLRLSGANDFGSNGVVLQEGTLELAEPGAMGRCPIQIAGGTLSLRSDGPASVAFGNDVLVQSDATINVDHLTTSSGRVMQLGRLSLEASVLRTTAGNDHVLEFTSATLTGNGGFLVMAPLTIAGAINESAGPCDLKVAEFSTSTLTLGGTTPNTYTGVTRVEGGGLILNKSAGAAVPGDLSIADGFVRLLADQQISATSAVVLKTGGAILDLNGYSQTVSSLTITNALVCIGTTTNGSAVLRSGLLTITGIGKLDLANNRLIVDYTGVSPAASIRSLLSHNSIVGSTALGYAEASELLHLNGAATGEWNGQTVDSTSLLVLPAISGDTDLNGAVSFSDLVSVAQHYGITDGTATWSEGDVNYDGNVTFADLVLVAQHYGQSMPVQPIGGASPAFEADLYRAFAEVPEPGAVGLVLIGAACWALGRGRRALTNSGEGI
jgi:fibronectin-binding autotransporter adhesin